MTQANCFLFENIEEEKTLTHNCHDDIVKHIHNIKQKAQNLFRKSNQGVISMHSTTNACYKRRRLLTDSAGSSVKTKT